MSAQFTSKTKWRAKLEKPQEPRVFPICGRFLKRFGPGTMVIPRPLDVDALMRLVPKTRLATMNDLRARLAQQYRADFA